jgi:predicted HTH transcriptional regulator
MLACVKMTASDVLRCMVDGEGARVEFKRVLPRDERAARTLCAFANTRGGLLIVGVTDRGRVHGVHRPEQITERLSMLSEIYLSPALAVETQVLEVEGPRVVACSVPFSRARPHAVLLPDGERQVVVRVGASNRIADGPTLEALQRNLHTRNGRNALEEEVVVWVRSQARSRVHPAGTATVTRFSRAFNIGEARARRTFVRLEILGLLIGHGAGRARIYTAP